MNVVYIMEVMDILECDSSLSPRARSCHIVGHDVELDAALFTAMQTLNLHCRTKRKSDAGDDFPQLVECPSNSNPKPGIF
jgi:hypothetical protein